MGPEGGKTRSTPVKYRQCHEINQHQPQTHPFLLRAVANPALLLRSIAAAH
jgi:hypothetical protein